jgi:hypothetical protein
VKLQDRVSFVVNAPYPDLLKLLGKASVGLSTMVDEHFGINVVEFMVSSYRRCLTIVELTDCDTSRALV